MQSVRESPLRQIAAAVYKNKDVVFALAIFLVVANLFSIYLIRQEHFIYYMDQVNYWEKFARISSHFVQDPLDTVKNVIYSIREEDYNDLPAFLLMPFGLLFGTGRLAYILAIVNIFAFAAGISFVMLQKKMCKMYGETSMALPYVAVASVLLLPNFWQPILVGYLDVGGVFLINLILFLHLQHPESEQRLRNLILIAVLIPILILFRRWYAYWGLAFYLALIIEACGRQIFPGRSDVKNFVKWILLILMQISISALVLFLVAPTFASRIGGTNYADMYSAYHSNTPVQEFLSFVNRFGLFYLFLVVSGAVCVILNKRIRWFAVLLLVQGLVIFTVFSHTQYFGRHHFYLLMPTMLLFSSFFIVFILRHTTRLKAFSIGGILLISLFNFVPAFSSRELWYAKMCPFLFTGFRQPPLVRNDIREIDRILETLEGLALNADERIYVLAGSDIFNCQTLNRAYLSLGRHKNVARKISWTHSVDKRDGFPQDLLTAKYVVVATPIQYEMRPEDQRVMGIPAELILQHTGLGTSFNKLPYEFHLDQDVQVSIYEKIKPLSDSDLNSLSGALKMYYPDRPNIFQIRNH